MTTRRDFLRQTALLGAGLSISPFFIKAGSAGVGANDKIGVGLIGCNGMGFEDLKAFLRNPEVECIALSDIDENVLNNRAAETEKITGKKVKHLYKDWRKLIDNKDIDLVIVGTPIIGTVCKWYPLAKPGRMCIVRNRWEIVSRNVTLWYGRRRNTTGSCR